MKNTPDQPRDEQLVEIRQEFAEGGQAILKEFVGRVREIARDGIFCIFQEVGPEGELVGEELMATFKRPEFLTASNNEEPSPGKIFHLTLFETEGSPDFRVTYRKPREFTPEQLERIKARAVELRKAIGRPPMGPIL